MADLEAEVVLMTTIICGGPGTGKTTLAHRISREVISTDDYLHLGRNTMLRAIAPLITPTCTVEGCEAARLPGIGAVPSPSLILWVGPTTPTKYPERYRKLIREWLAALDSYSVVELPRKPDTNLVPLIGGAP